MNQAIFPEGLDPVSTKLNFGGQTLTNYVFIPSIFTQVYLPRSLSKELVHHQKNGKAEVVLKTKSSPLPHGSLIRLVMIDITTYAIQKNTHEIFIENSASKYLKRLGLDNQGARHHNLRKQLRALAACHFYFEYLSVEFYGCPIFKPDEEIETEIDFKGAWPKLLILSDDFFKVITESAVPLEQDAITKLKGSALAIDIYVWLVHRLFRLKQVTHLPWKVVRNQFALGYSGEHSKRSFKKKFLIALDKVKKVYPQANIEFVRGGILLKHSRYAVPQRQGETV